MKKRSTILSLVLAVTLVFCMSVSVFAEEPVDPSTVDTSTVQSYKDFVDENSGIVKSEVNYETFAMALANQTVEGKYKLVDTKTLKEWLDKGEKMVVIDTMPGGWYAKHHIPTALSSVVGGGAENGPAFLFQDGEKEALDKLIKEKCSKSVKKYYNKKTKKWQTKKIKGAKTKTVKVLDKKAKIVVYCGFTKCQRSHQGAMYLAKKGFKNVYRYPGGISAWKDAGNEIVK